TAAPEAVPPESPKEAHYELVQDLPALERWIAAATVRGVIAVDTETTSLDPVAADLVGISLSTAAGKACYIPLGHTVGKPADGGLDLEGAGEPPEQIARDQALTLLKPMLEHPGILKVGHNIKYDLLVFARHGITVAPVECTMLLSYVLEAGLHGH